MTETDQPAVPAAPPPHWLFAPSSLGPSFRIYLPTVLLVRALGLGKMLLFAYLILRAEYGLQRLALLLINVLSALARLGVPAGLERYAPQHEQSGQLAPFLRRGMLLGLAVTGAVVLLGAAVSPWLAPAVFAAEPDGQQAGPGYLLRIVLACLAATLVLTMFLNIQGILRGLRMYRALSAMEVLHGVSFLLFGVVGLVLAGNLRLADGQLVKLPGAALVLVLAYAASMLLSAGVIGLGLAGHLGRWTSQHRPLGVGIWAFAGRLMRFSAYITGPNVLWTLFPLLALWRVNKLLGPGDAGLFALTRDMMNGVQLLAMAIWPTAQNSATHLWERNEHKAAVVQLALVFRISGWLLWLASAGLVLARGPVEWLLPAGYGGAGELIPWLLIMFLYLIHLSLPTAHAYLLEKTRLLFVAAAGGLAAHAMSVDWLVGIGGGVGAAQSASLGAISALAVLLLGVRLAGGRGPQADAETDRRAPLIAARESALLFAPLLLAAPAVLGAWGAWVLAGAAMLIMLMLAATDILWTSSDRRVLAGYLVKTWRAIRPRSW